MMKSNGVLIPSTEGNQILFNQFVEKLDEGQTVDVFLEAQGNEKSLAQLAKAHAMIRKLAQETGNTFEDMKKYVKTRSGINKSFADCSREEMMSVISTLNDLYDFNGLIY